VYHEVENQKQKNVVAFIGPRYALAFSLVR